MLSEHLKSRRTPMHPASHAPAVDSVGATAFSTAKPEKSSPGGMAPATLSMSALLLRSASVALGAGSEGSRGWCGPESERGGQRLEGCGRECGWQRCVKRCVQSSGGVGGVNFGLLGMCSFVHPLPANAHYVTPSAAPPCTTLHAVPLPGSLDPSACSAFLTPCSPSPPALLLPPAPELPHPLSLSLSHSRVVFEVAECKLE